MFEKIFAGITIVLGFFAVILIIGLLISWPFMLLWNACLVGTVAGIGPITSVWHSWGILILCGFMFKSAAVTTPKA